MKQATDNGDLPSKLSVRKWALNQVSWPKVLELFAGTGVMYENCYKGVAKDHLAFDLKGAERDNFLQGDNRVLIQKHVNGGWNVYDADAYSNPWVVLSDVCRYREPGKFALIATCNISRGLRTGNANSYMRYVGKYPFKTKCPLLAWFYKDFIGMVVKHWQSYGVTVKAARYAHNRFVPSYQTKYFAFLVEKSEE